MILEYQLPMELRRPDVVVLRDGSVVVIEIKSKGRIDLQDVDQVEAYARDLRCYHRACHWPSRHVYAVLMLMRYSGTVQRRNGVVICGPDQLSDLVETFESGDLLGIPSLEEFLDEGAYCPLPSLINAARELFATGDLRPIKRARAGTDPAVARISAIIHEAQQTKSRRLILLSGIPGAGKTLVGLRVVHSEYLDDLRSNDRSVPAVFLSGNGPLVQVLQYELRGAGGGGKAFVRDVKSYREKYMKNPAAIPPEHVVVSDEAQRAWDGDRMDDTCRDKPILNHREGWGEPRYFIEFSDRKPDWSVIVALIGSGQEIHVGEESGIQQWADAVNLSSQKEHWTIHGPSHLISQLTTTAKTSVDANLTLDIEVRYHAARHLTDFVEKLLKLEDADRLTSLAETLAQEPYHLRISRDLDECKQYLRERYAEDSRARYGIVASSRDKDLHRFGIANDYQSTKRIKVGPWYAEDESSPLSCRHLDSVVTEFGCQGLELDAVLLAWGTDFIVQKGRWSNSKMTRYRGGVTNPFQLRLNAYRVLLTRGRDATIVFVPRLSELDETFEYFVNAGFQELTP